MLEKKLLELVRPGAEQKKKVKKNPKSNAEIKTILNLSPPQMQGAGSVKL